jgi:hypothetical protein
MNHESILKFVIQEARLLDEKRFDEWYELFTDDAFYWVPLAPGDIQYAGVSPYFIGLYQINLRVPDGVPSGNQPVIVKVGVNQSPAGGYLAVQ